jgi:hypothetical protein
MLTRIHTKSFALATIGNLSKSYCDTNRQESIKFTFPTDKPKLLSERNLRVFDSTITIPLSSDRSEIDEELWEEYEKTSLFPQIPYGELLGYNRFGIHLQMPGIALVVAELKIQKKIDNIFVCMTHEAFHIKLDQILKDPHDIKCALIVSKGSSIPDHKLVICIEKKQNSIQTAVIDSLATSTAKDISYTIQEFCAFYPIHCSVFYFRHTRLQENYGCSVFAIQDAFSFMQDPNFFKEIAPYGKFNENKLIILSFLPPGFMRGTQNRHILNEYISSHPEQILSPIYGHKKNLDQYIEKYFFKKKHRTCNYYINKKHNKYILQAIKYSKTLSLNEIQDRIKNTLLI